MQDSALTILIDLAVVLLAQHFLPVLFPADDVAWWKKLVILVAIFIVLYYTLLLFSIPFHRFKFRHLRENVIMEYQGQKITVYQDFISRIERLKADKMHTVKTWYSDEKHKFSVTTPGFGVEKIKQEGYDNEYYILFPKMLRFKQRVKFSTKFEGCNSKRRYNNYYWMDIHNPTDYLTVELRIPKEYCKENGKLLLQEFLKYEDAPGNTKKEVPFDGYYKWEIKNPKVHWSYKLEWEWSQAERERIAKKTKK